MKEKSMLAWKFSQLDNIREYYFLLEILEIFKSVKCNYRSYHDGICQIYVDCFDYEHMNIIIRKLYQSI